MNDSYLYMDRTDGSVIAWRKQMNDKELSLEMLVFNY